MDAKFDELLTAIIQQELSHWFRLFVKKRLRHVLSALVLLNFEFTGGAKVIVGHGSGTMLALFNVFTSTLMSIVPTILKTERAKVTLTVRTETGKNRAS